MAKKYREPEQESFELDQAAEAPVEEPKQPPPPVKLNLGCGMRKLAGYVNIDNREICKPDLLLDVRQGLPFEDSSVDEIHAFDFLEHIPKLEVPAVMREIHRVLKPTGFMEFQIPSTDGRGAFQDPFHISYWNKNSWLYYVEGIWHELYPELPLFKGWDTINDVVTSTTLRIVHTQGKVWPVK